MKYRSLYPFALCGIVALASACDATIHRYPTPSERLVVVELNVDRTPPLLYKELTYDEEGVGVERLLDPEPAAAYEPSERLCMRIIAELYAVPHPEARAHAGQLVARRELPVDRLLTAPQDTVQFRVPDGNYRVLAWADYAPVSNVSDWHFETPSLNEIRVKLDHAPRNNHHKSCGAGTVDFTVDFSRDPAGTPQIRRQTRAGDEVVPLYLERAAGRFRLLATDLGVFLNSGKRIEDLRVLIRYRQYVSAGYNVDTQTPNVFVPTYEVETAPSVVNADGSAELAYDYVLASTGQEDHVLVDLFIYEGDVELNHYQNIDIPLYRNRETVVRGPFLTRTFGSGQIGIDDDFDDEYLIVIPD